MPSLPPAPAGFLDAVGGLPMGPEAAAAQAQAAQAAWADPLRLHHRGRQSALFLDTARASLAASIAAATGVRLGAEQVHFAASMQQAARWAAAGFLGATRFAASAVEALAVVDGIAEHAGAPALLPVDRQGLLDQSAVRALEPDDRLVLAVQAANVEIGTRQDLQVCAAHGSRLLVDASQCLGRIELGAHWSVLLAWASDWGGPTGLVVLAVHPQARWSAPAPAVGGWLGGGASPPAVVAAATALETLLPLAPPEAEREFALIERLRAGIQASIPDVDLAGHPQQRLPHILNCSFLYISGESLVLELDRRGFAVASGSACVADSDRASHVLVATGGYTGGNLRVSLPFGCTVETVDDFLDQLIEVVALLRQEAGM